MSRRMDTPKNIRIKVGQALQRMSEHNMKEIAALKEWMSEQCKKTFVEIQELDIERTTPQFDHLVEHEEYVHEEVALDASVEQSYEASDTHTSDSQDDDQDAREGSYVLAPRHDEIQRLDDPLLDIDMRSCVGKEELPMELSVTQSLPSRTFMLDMTQEDISDIQEVLEEPCVVLEHKGHVDLQTQDERHDLETDDYIHTYQYGESESPLLGSPLIDQVVETGSLLGYSLPGPFYSDEDALLIGRDDHISCLDTYVWDPSADDISRVSAREDTVAHTGYSAIQRGVAVGDGVQWQIGGLSSTVEVGSSVPYILRSVLLGIPLLTLAVRGMRQHLNRIVIRSHDT
jgi:hypothetical protein